MRKKYEIVTVIDLSGYKKIYAEPVPFPADLEEVDGLDHMVRSHVTGKPYILTDYQIIRNEGISVL
jgi:hypothetical protein